MTLTTDGRITLWRIPDGTKLANYQGEQQSLTTATTGFAANLDLSLAAYGAEKRIHVIELRWKGTLEGSGVEACHHRLGAFTGEPHRSRRVFSS